MMKIYKVELETLTYDWGRHEGWELIGYYTNKEKAERIAEQYEENKGFLQGEVRLEEIEVDTED